MRLNSISVLVTGILAVGATLVLSACTSSGPFVTSISSDGTGGLTVVSCASTYNAFMGTQGNGECSTTHVQVVQKPQS